MANRRDRRVQKKLNNAAPKAAPHSPVALQALQQGVLALQERQPDAALAQFQKVLDSYPNNSDALHLLGLTHKDLGDFATAEDLIRKALKINEHPLYHLNLSLVLQQSGKIEEAIRETLEYLKHNPDDVNSINSLGNLLRTAGLIDEALKQYEHALKLEPNNDGVISNLGLAHMYNGDHTLAEQCFKRAIELNDQNYHALNNLGLLRKYQARKDEARDYFQRAIAINPDFTESQSNLAETLDEEDLSVIEAKLREVLPRSPEPEKTLKALAINLFHQRKYEETLVALHEAMQINPNRYDFFNMFGETLLRMKRADEAVPFLEGALQLEPKAVEAQTNLGIAHHAELRFPEALAAFDRALELRPAFPEALCNKGVTLLHMSGWAESEAPLRRAIELAPGFIDGHWNLGLCLLAIGQIAEGWSKYAMRYEAPTFVAPRRHFPVPQWDGSPLKGKKIIAWAEQGIGDEILFASVLPEIMGQGAEEIMIECTPRLVPLFARSFPEATVVGAPYGPAESGKVPLDWHIAFPDLCGLFRASVDAFPRENVFLKPDPKAAQKWKDRFAAISDRPKIGVTWRSLLITKIRSSAYATIEDLAPLLSMKGVDFVNLQCGECEEEIAEARERYGVEIHAWDDIDLKDDQDEVAALTSNLDFIVGPTNAATYLGAAVGVPTYMFLPQLISWVMLGKKGTLPWFPTSKTFSKLHPHDDWNQTFEAIAAHIHKNM